MQRLNSEGISLAESEWKEGGAPLARMLKQVFSGLGLAWVTPAERVQVTPAGEAFLASKDPDGAQFWNPSVRSKVHKAIALHPIPFLGELLRSIADHRISAVYFTLFVSRAKSFSDVDMVIEQIERFRGPSMRPSRHQL